MERALGPRLERHLATIAITVTINRRHGGLSIPLESGFAFTRHPLVPEFRDVAYKQAQSAVLRNVTITSCPFWETALNGMTADRQADSGQGGHFRKSQALIEAFY
jgi:hypothetical protein